MSSLGDYPTMSQSEWDEAPFNEDMPVEVETVVSMTISKPVTLIMKAKEEYTQRELSEAAYKQLDLAPALRDWDIDEFEVTEG